MRKSLAAVLVLILVLVVVLVLILIVALILVLVLVVLILVVHRKKPPILILRHNRNPRIPENSQPIQFAKSAFILCLKNEAGKQSGKNRGSYAAGSSF